ncbi:helix-turn-helix domain-containing protein [Chitinophaga japonensis]|nr:helix-turn-helix transcriptional regulator [Chitinophaga japonensis]
MKQEERILKDFGKRLKAMREAKGWTQLDLAFPLKSSVSHVSKLENGHSEPGLLMLHRLAAILECTVPDLVKDA